MLDSEQSPQKNPARWGPQAVRRGRPRGGRWGGGGGGRSRAPGTSSSTRGSRCREHGVELHAAIDVAVEDDAERLDSRYPEVVEPSQQAVLAPGEVLVHLLQRVQAALFGHEAHLVPRGTPVADLDEAVVLPFLERKVPGEAQETGSDVGWRSEDVAHSTRSSGPAGPRHWGQPIL